MSPFVYTPFYFIAVYAFICQKEWIRIPGFPPIRFLYTSEYSLSLSLALMWAWGMFLVLLACIREELVGPYKTSNVPVVLAAYGGYVAVPLLLMLRMASAPVFGNKEKAS